MPELTQKHIEDWISTIKGTFDIKDLWFEFNIRENSAKKKSRTYLSRCEEKELLVYLGGNKYRKKDDKKIPVPWQIADPDNYINLKYPFGIEEYALIYPRNIVIVAGLKQAGKTEFLYEFIKMNMDKFDIELFNSETGPEQMHDRFNNLGIPETFTSVYERYSNFADVIDPDKISVIDYLDMNSEHYLVGVEIDQIFQTLRNGVAIIGMQIPPPSKTIVRGVEKLVDRDYAYGGGSTAKRAFIYISMLSGRKLKLKHVKKPANPKINPENMMWTYSIDEIGMFCNIQRYYGDSL